MQTVLAKIVADKAIWVEARKQQQPLASFQNEIQPSTRHFYDALQGARTAFILSVRKHRHQRRDSRRFRSGAYCQYLSTLRLGDLGAHRRKIFSGASIFCRSLASAPQPILCKDFIIDPIRSTLPVTIRPMPVY